MSMKLSPLISNVHSPPISEVRRWVNERPDDGMELIDLCRADDEIIVQYYLDHQMFWASAACTPHMSRRRGTYGWLSEI